MKWKYKYLDEYEVVFPKQLCSGDTIIFKRIPVKIQSIVKCSGMGSLFWGEYWTFTYLPYSTGYFSIDSKIFLKLDSLFDSEPIIRIKKCQN